VENEITRRSALSTKERARRSFDIEINTRKERQREREREREEEGEEEEIQDGMHFRSDM